MNIKQIVFLSVITILIMNCKKSEVAPETQQILTAKSASFDWTNSNSSALTSRLSIAGDIVVLEDGANTRTLSPSNDIVWTFVADVNPLTYGGSQLSATHIEVLENYAVVSYHVRGDEHKGGIEVINISNGHDPWVTSQAFFQDADINSILIDSSSNNNTIILWASLSDKNKGAVLIRAVIQNGILQPDYNYVNLSNHLDSGISASANGISQKGDLVYVSSGKSHGGVFCFDTNTLEFIGNSSFTHSKYVSANGSNIGSSDVVSLQTRENANLKVAKLGQTDFDITYPISSISHQNTDAPNRGKNSFHFHPSFSNQAYVAMGSNGIHVYDISNGNLIYETPSGFIDRGNSNGLSFDNDLFYAANGADGLAVFTTPESQLEAPELTFVWDLDDENASANFVEAHEEWIFIAKGQGGVKILKQPTPGSLQVLSTFDPQGVPDNLAPDQEVCSTLLPTIFSNALPEGQNAITAHPEYFQNSVFKEIYIQEEAEVFMTFLHEGAGYRNTLGYYYYDADNPPSSEEDLIKIVIFPNASAAGSGGNLDPGNTMELLGSFDANTVIGFFLISNGWQSNGVTNGIDTQYTIPEFNNFGDTQTIIFHDQTCNATVVCFEDINVTSGGDKDFNDAIFQIRSEPESAISIEDYIGL